MIKLITPKRDLYMDGDTYNPEGLFGKKGKFYEVRESTYHRTDIVFTDERGSEHEYDLEFLDEDFWTVDFEKGFEFLSTINEHWYMKNNEAVTKKMPKVKTVCTKEAIKICISVIKNGGWTITRFSNQVPSHPEKISYPYENWKKDIGEAKFHRCTDKCGVLLMIVDNICGFIDEGNRLFYYQKYHLGKQTYLCCKVSYSCADGWYFVRENKDSALVKEYSDVLASFKVPVEESTPIPDWLVNDLGKPDLHDHVRNVNKITTSLKVPEDKEEPLNPEYQFRSGDQIVTDNIAKQGYFDRQMELDYKNTYESSGKHVGEVSEWDGSVCTSEEAITSDGGKSDYYKIVLPQWLLDKQLENGYIMLEDLTEVMFKNDFNYTNVFKAQKRMFELQQGKGKKGNTLEYDANKVKYYVDKQLEVFNRD